MAANRQDHMHDMKGPVAKPLRFFVHMHDDVERAADSIQSKEVELEVRKGYPPKGHPQNLLEFYLNFLNP